jgi:hypothetical protein
LDAGPTKPTRIASYPPSEEAVPTTTSLPAAGWSTADAVSSVPSTFTRTMPPEPKPASREPSDRYRTTPKSSPVPLALPAATTLPSTSTATAWALSKPPLSVVSFTDPPLNEESIDPSASRRMTAKADTPEPSCEYPATTSLPSAVAVTAVAVSS